MLVLSACGSKQASEENRYSGLLKPTGITSYQYGTHRLETKDTFYALKSEKINLEEYENERIEITATPVKGYPVDGGPVYLNVTRIHP